MGAPVRLASEVFDKIWGTPETEPWFKNPGRRNVGEIWFSASRAVPLLVKLLFTSDRLSVQVHPGDGYAWVHEKQSRGKTEMWHILRAEPDSRIALGLSEAVTPGRLHESAVSGEIMKLLNWIPVRKGDTFFVPAGTIHAIGGGIVLCEVQQHSDVTYRLYDYGRPRELHIDHSVAVSHLDPGHAAAELPVKCRYFHTDRVEVNGSYLAPSPARNTIYVALEGSGLIAGQPFQAGEAFEIEEGAEPFEVESAAASFLVTSPAGSQR